MKKLSITFIFMFALILFPGCELEDIENPNAPTVSSFAEGASAGDIMLLATGLEAIMRSDLEFHYDTVSILGREYYDLTSVDPRFTGELLKGPLDNNGFLTTRAYAAWYKIVKSANILIEAVENSVAGLSDEQKNDYYGYAKTLKAYALLMVANRQYENGIRIDVADPDNLGPNVGYSEALTAIMSLLDEANSDLSNGTSDFVSLSSGFDGFDTASTFSEFNRAIAARVALYQGNDQLVLNLLEESFFDLDGDLYEGPAHVFGLTGNDILNAQYHVPLQSGQEFMVHPSWINDAASGDLRVEEKSIKLQDTVQTDGLRAIHQITVYESNVDPVYLIRNEELILIYAEANIGIDNSETIKAINRVRNEAGLSDYSGPTDDNSLLQEVLRQRRYSLMAEGHRWIDLRRLDMLNEANIPLDRTGDNIIDAFPTPFTEQLN
ncbi:RagB/SusD family nutrient uptake outer membrane protein [Christiangramia sediminis]|uniref:RagB/SusD family nutrient uptake outer membrane protein n=1 Tax=Christiangramia sediminis TaxID=2881336 RepID=A0A9X1LKT7_9FLAO|nr:RagB/SusD family nutrient uptake outer membrane protein [Christiangramia sediminis]MCB7482215.1 RagB/SusD family nutrient uptake outer membrane protein [Christiangramia sediminis]